MLQEKTRFEVGVVVAGKSVRRSGVSDEVVIYVILSLSNTSNTCNSYWRWGGKTCIFLRQTRIGKEEDIRGVGRDLWSTFGVLGTVLVTTINTPSPIVAPTAENEKSHDSKSQQSPTPRSAQLYTMAISLKPKSPSPSKPRSIPIPQQIHVFPISYSNDSTSVEPRIKGTTPDHVLPHTVIQPGLRRGAWGTKAGDCAARVGRRGNFV